MDKTILKKFAIESRQDLMEKVKNKINTFYIDEEFQKNQKGDLYILFNEKHSLSLTHEEYKKRELLIKRIKELSLEQVIEEAAYTWFNRIIAIRYMEINDMLPLTKDNQSLGIRVLSSKDNVPDPEILKFTNLMNPELDIDFKKEKYAELKDDNEKFKYVLLLVCKKLGRVIPQVFDGVTDYIDILIPDNLLNDTGFVTKVINEVPENNFKQVEIIGWLYQYYNQTEKDRVMSEKNAYKKNEIPYATQLFTPDWIVQYMVQNSLGRFWIEHSDEDDMVENWKYLVKENIETKKEKLNPVEITFIDPCCGSGHILVYAFELFYQMYLINGYNKKDIPELILKNNLYGLDVDDRAGQLSILSIILKAREYDKTILNKKIVQNLNILSIQESNNISDFALETLNENIKNKIKYLKKSLENSKEYGSLIVMEDIDYTEVIEYIEQAPINFETINLRENCLPLIKIARILSKKYNIAVTNPPYVIKAKLEMKLRNFLDKNYKKFSNDLFTAFIKRMENFLISNDSYYSMITPHSWMTLGDLIDIRNELLENYSIINMAHMGVGAFGTDFGTTAFVISSEKKDNFNSIFIELSPYKTSEDKKINFLKAKRYQINQEIFKTLPNKAIAYTISKNMLKNFTNGVLGKVIITREGMTTGNNDKFLRMWFEIENNKMTIYNDINCNSKWFPYNKGGVCRKWYGNKEYVVNWEDSGKEIKNFKDEKTGRTRSHNYNGEFIFKDGITWGAFSSIGASFRISEKNTLFDSKGSMAFAYNNDNLLYYLALLNSNVVKKYLEFLSGTRDTKPGHLLNLPFIFKEKPLVEVNKLVKLNISISKNDWDSFETSWDFKKHPLLEFIDSMPGLHDSNLKVPPTHLKIVKNNYGEGCFIADELPMRARISDSFRKWEEYTEKQFNTLKNNEEELNKIFIDIYGLQDELTPEEEDKDVTIRKADQEREIKSLISYAVGCMFGRYSLDKEGLIYAGGDFDQVYKKYKGEYGGWAGASLANYTVLNDNGKEIDLSFEVDNDNVIPITDEAYFRDDIVERFKKFISVAYGKETLNENLDFIAETLGKKGTETSEDTIRRYFVNDFFNDHVKIYQKRPIYWLFDSGKKNGFKALIYMHRYNENLVPKIRLDYLHRMQTTYEKLLSDINYKLTTELSMTDKKETQKKQADLNAKLQEIKEYDEKIAHIANQRISIDLDDGVKVNYEKFKDILAKIR